MWEAKIKGINCERSGKRRERIRKSKTVRQRKREGEKAMERER